MLAIIDGDVLAYQACRSRWDKTSSIVNGVNVVQLDEAGKRVVQEFTAEDDTKYLQASWENFKKDLTNMLDKLYCTEFMMVVKGKDNYRDEMYPEYKMNRHADPSKQNKFVPHIRDLAVFEGYAVYSTGREADDLMRIWAEEARAVGQEFIICSIDKDLRCIPGTHYIMHYDETKQKVIEITPEEGRRHYYEQLLKGDPTDNIPGVPRVGEVKAAKLLAGCVTENDFQEVIVEQYLMAYGHEHWYDYFVSNAKMIHLQTHLRDYFNCLDWPIIKELC